MKPIRKEHLDPVLILINRYLKGDKKEDSLLNERKTQKITGLKRRASFWRQKIVF